MRKHLAFALAGIDGRRDRCDQPRRRVRPVRAGSRGEPRGCTRRPRRVARPYAPPPRHAQYGQPYFFGHVGVFSPNDDSDGLRGYDSGGNFDFGVGSRVSPLFAIDGTIGGYRAERGSDDATVVPLTIGGRLILPAPLHRTVRRGRAGALLLETR